MRVQKIWEIGKKKIYVSSKKMWVRKKCEFGKNVKSVKENVNSEIYVNLDKNVNSGKKCEFGKMRNDYISWQNMK